MLGKLRKALGGDARGRFDRSLEIGAGTGYFSLNLLQAGVIGDADVHRHLPGHARRAASATPSALGLDVETRRRRRRGAAVRGRQLRPRASATRSCTTCPTSTRRSREFHRVLRPGGTVVFAGEPSRYGDRIANVPKRAASRVAPLWRRADARARRRRRATSRRRRREPPARGRSSTSTPSRPSELAGAARARRLRRRARARRGAAGQLVRLGQPRAGGDRRPRRRAVGAGASTPSAATSRCSSVDRALLEPRLPPAIFYNLMIAGRKPR